MQNSKGNYKGLALVRDVGYNKKHRGTMVTEHGVDEFGNGVALVVIHGWTDQWHELLSGYDAMGAITVHPAHVIELLDENTTFKECAVLRVAEFYYNWKGQERFICPTCKSHFLFDLEGNSKCHGCEAIAQNKPVVDWLWNSEFTDIELTDEMVAKYNQKVIIKYYTKIFNQFKDLHPDSWISEQAPEFLMEHGNKMGKYYAKHLTTEQLHDMREVFKNAYIHACEKTRKRYGRKF